MLPSFPSDPYRPDRRSFADLGVSRQVAETLRMRGISEPFPIQTLVLRDALAGRDVLARSRTGSGKTLAFAVPIVERVTPGGGSPNALILAPTRELASQVTEEFRAIADVKRLKVAAVYGGVGLGPQAKRARHADIVIATPGRLLDLVQRKMLRLDRVRICVLDEADRMLDMGFLPDVTRILEMLRPDRQTMLFSATLEGAIGRLATRFIDNPVRHEVAGEDGPLVTEAHHRFVAVDQAGRSARARSRARSRPRPDAGLRSNQARRRPAGAEPEGRGLPRGSAARRDDAAGSGAGTRAVRRGRQRRAGGDRRRRAWARPRTHHPRHQLRPAGRREGLSPSGGPHRPRRAERHRHHLRDAGQDA